MVTHADLFRQWTSNRRIPIDRLVMLVFHVIPAVVALCLADFTVPYCTVSDMLGTPAGQLILPGLWVQAAWFAFHKRTCAVTFFIGACFPLFRLRPPIMLTNMDAQYAAHFVWACCGATSLMLIAPAAKVVALSTCFGVCYFGGFFLRTPLREYLILIGCVLEWVLCFILPVVYITPLVTGTRIENSRSNRANHRCLNSPDA